MRRDGTWEAPRELIHGGYQPGGCVLGGRAHGCNRFAIARIASDPATGRLHLVWGWSEASLSGKCDSDAGYCDHDLNYAYSNDRGATWHDAAGRRTTRIAERPLPADAPAFRVVHGRVGLFKAVTVGPAGLLLVYSQFVAGTQRLMAARVAGGRWTSAPIAPDRAHSGWRGSLVLRGGESYTLWTPTGNAIFLLYGPNTNTSGGSMIVCSTVDAHEAQHAVGRRLVAEMVAEFGPPPSPAPRPRSRGDQRARDRRKTQRAARRRNRR